MPRVSSKTVDAAAEKVGQDAATEFSTDGALEVDRPVIEPVEGPGALDKAARLAFMEEPVKILVHESSDPNDPDPSPLLRVNGRNQYIIRGTEQTVRRKYVEVLARARKTGYTQSIRHDQVTGNVHQKMNPRTALRYPFSVIEDRNPNGSAWLRKILAEG
jgi:hypothetical protein